MKFVTAIDKRDIETHSFVVDRSDDAEIYALIVRTDQQYRELVSWNLWDAGQNQLTDAMPELKAGLPDGKMLIVMVMNDTLWRMDAAAFFCAEGRCHVRLTPEAGRLSHVAALLTDLVPSVVRFDLAFEDPQRSLSRFRVANRRLAQ